MGIKDSIIEFINQRKKTIGRPKNQININGVYFAYTTNGEICKPFIFSNNYTQVEDLISSKTEPMVIAKNKPDVYSTLSKLYDPNQFIHFSHISDMITRYTDGAEIDGDELAQLRTNVSIYNEAFREFVIKDTLSRKYFIKREGLLPLTEQIQQRILETNAARKRREELFNDSININ